MKLTGPVLASVLLAACGTSSAAPANPDAAHLNTTVMDLRQGQVVNGVPCLIADLPEHHVHVHVGVYVDGVSIIVPAGIGVGRPWGFDNTGFLANGACFAWMHTHDTTGVVHIVTPDQKVFTLGQLFEVWGQPLAPGVAFNYQGMLTVLVDGRPNEGDPREVPLTQFENIILELGQPPAVPPASLYDFSTLQR
ncbi:MAG: hypothetical protein WCC30_03935 [Candidatus Dormiibacterota bacterium]